VCAAPGIARRRFLLTRAVQRAHKNAVERAMPIVNTRPDAFAFASFSFEIRSMIFAIA
jgi:hypothetical protein